MHLRTSIYIGSNTLEFSDIRR